MGATAKSDDTNARPACAGDASGRAPVHVASGLTARDASLRQCAATRQVRPAAELIRFVAGPENLICPDLAGKLPGRGVWVSAHRDAIAQAVKTGAFSRGLKRKVNAPDDLPATVERLLEQRVFDALCLANKAGNVVTGFEKVAGQIERGALMALIHAIEAADGGTEKLDRKFKAAGRSDVGCSSIILADCLTISQMSLAIGRPNVVHAGLRYGGATERFVAEARRLVDYRKGVENDPPS